MELTYWDRVRQFNVTRQELIDYLESKGYATWCFCTSQLRDAALAELEKAPRPIKINV